jgi:hypothetical protein
MIVTGTADGLGPRECPQYSGRRYGEVEQAASHRGVTIPETYRPLGYCRR